LVVIILALILLMVRQLCERRILIGNLLSVALMLVVAIVLIADGAARLKKLTPHAPEVSSNSSTEADAPSTFAGQSAMPTASTEERPTLWSRIRARADLNGARMGMLRRAFIRGYPNSGSTIDRDTTFNNAEEVIHYLPRAMSIGFFAPFPEMWLARGTEVGTSGRLISGLETLVMYILECLALFALWQSRRRLVAWFLLLIATFGVTLLSLIVANLGALYRMRYVFWILLIILGAKGAGQILLYLSTIKSTKHQTASAT
jgi:hypothetical protein